VNYCVVPGVNHDAAGAGIARVRTLTTTTALIEVRTTDSGILTDPVTINFAAFGDQ
jgi:hypothetical protein